MLRFLSDMYLDAPDVDRDRHAAILLQIVRNSSAAPVCPGPVATAASNALSLLVAGRLPLAGEDLSGISAPYAHLAQAALSGVNFSGAQLVGANLAGSCLDGCDLRGTNLSGCELSLLLLGHTGFFVCVCQQSTFGCTLSV